MTSAIMFGPKLDQNRAFGLHLGSITAEKNGKTGHSRYLLIQRVSCRVARGLAKIRPRAEVLALQWTLRLAARVSSGGLSHCTA